MIVVHRIALDPNRAQEESFRKSAGCARFAYNWALNAWREQYQAGSKPSEGALRRLLNEIKREKFPWLLEVSKNVIQQAIKNLGAAFSHFSRRPEEYRNEPDPRKKKTLGKKLGYPKFKKKGRSRDSFRADNGPEKGKPDAVRVDGKSVVLPVLGRIKMRERLRSRGRIKSAIVSRTGTRWFVAISVDVPDEVRPRKNHAVVGVDLGIETLATVADAGRQHTKEYVSPKATKKLARKRRRLAQALSREQGPEPGKKPSANFLKASRKIARLEARIATIRIDATHKATTDIVRNSATIVLEDLDVQGMLANHKLAGPISDAAFSEFRRRIEYKAKRHATTVEHAPRFFPSSKMCSKCGHINDNLTLKDREWTCLVRGTHHRRDVTAAVNLANRAGSPSATACGAASSGTRRTPRTKLAAVKQEPTRGIKSRN